MTQKVIVIGGGVAGMNAAHELAIRGFQVEIYDRNPHYVGGKARSIAVPGTSTNGEFNNLPGEHGFRFFPGFYKHITDTMSRIPYGTKGKTCFDNLVATETVQICQTKFNMVELLFSRKQILTRLMIFVLLDFVFDKIVYFNDIIR